MPLFARLKAIVGLPKKPTGNTFSTLEVHLKDIKEENFEIYFQWLYEATENLKSDREIFYRTLRDNNSWWIKVSRLTLGTLGAVALLMTALAALAAMTEAHGILPKAAQTAGLFGAFMIYAIMGAIALFERGTDLSSSYFRHLTITIALRNLWNGYQLTMLREYPALRKAATGDADAARAKATEFALAFCKDVDLLVSTEQTEWRTEFIESLRELDTTAKDGLAKIQSEIALASDKVAKAAEEAKASLLLGDLNVTVQGDFDGDLLVLVDQSKLHEKPVMKKFSLRGLKPGSREIQVKSKRGDKDIIMSEVILVKAGIQNYNITLT